MKKSLCLVALLGLSAAVSSATIISVVDTFDTGTQQAADPSNLCSASANPNTLATGDAVGGYRTMGATNTAGGCASSDVDFSVANAYAASLPVNGTGSFYVIWNGNNGANSIDADFLAGFAFRARQDADAPPNEASTVQFRACQDAAGTVGCVDSTIVTINSQAYQNYSATFGAMQNDVNYIRMVVTGGLERDVTIDFVNAQVPEPSTFALAGVALLGLGLLRRR